MLKLKVKSKGKEYPIHMSPKGDTAEHCLQTIQKLMQYIVVEKEIARRGESDHSSGLFYGYRNVLNKLDELGYYTDL